jgi:hypothetical protein
MLNEVCTITVSAGELGQACMTCIVYKNLGIKI